MWSICAARWRMQRARRIGLPSRLVSPTGRARMDERSGKEDPFVVIAEFAVKPERLGEFLALAADDARCSTADEPGCRQFDVVSPQVDPNTVLFYEVYDSPEAFRAHLETPHLARFREGFPGLIMEE